MGQIPAGSVELSSSCLSASTQCACVCVSPAGHVADAAAGEAGGLRHLDGGGAQREGVCGGGLQTRGQDHCVSAHTDTLFPLCDFFFVG